MKLGLVPASASPSHHQQSLVNYLHGVAELLRSSESLGKEIASELHPDKRTGHFQRLYTFANLRKALFHMPEIRTCPTSQHLAASQPKRKRILGGQHDRSFGDWIGGLCVSAHHVHSCQKR